MRFSCYFPKDSYSPLRFPVPGFLLETAYAWKIRLMSSLYLSECHKVCTVCFLSDPQQNETDQ